ncbi:hypothetical protein [Streptomyces sp. NPDC059753]|uniref:hypothetical protein n=1 Tax=Streptomyces sp. NPDC059753 TaxID=3346933 RepID=UPI00365289EB
MDQPGEIGEQRGVRKDRRRQKAGRSLARDQGAGEPDVDIALNVAAGAAGEFVMYVALAGLGLIQRAQLAQRLELIVAGRDPGGFA